MNRRKAAENFDCHAFLDITTCLVSFLHRQCRVNRRLGAFIGWRLAGSIDGSKNNWYLPRFSTLPRNKVHFHGITISGNWHLQQHRDALWSSTRPIIFQNRQYARQRRGEVTRSRGCVQIANVFYTPMAPFRFSVVLVEVTPGAAAAADNKAEPSTAR